MRVSFFASLKLCPSHCVYGMLYHRHRSAFASKIKNANLLWATWYWKKKTFFFKTFCWSLRKGGGYFRRSTVPHVVMLYFQINNHKIVHFAKVLFFSSSMYVKVSLFKINLFNFWLKSFSVKNVLCICIECTRCLYVNSEVNRQLKGLSTNDVHCDGRWEGLAKVDTPCKALNTPKGGFCDTIFFECKPLRY